MANAPTDTELLDWLEQQNAKARYTGICVFRWSTTERGWRLHETEDVDNGHTNVRAAIAAAMEED